MPSPTNAPDGSTTRRAGVVACAGAAVALAAARASADVTVSIWRLNRSAAAPAPRDAAAKSVVKATLARSAYCDWSMDKSTLSALKATAVGPKSTR